MEWTADKVRKIQRMAYETDVASLNEIIEHNDTNHQDTTEVIELVPDDQTSMDELLFKKDGNDRLMEFIKRLPPKEQLVIRMRFGLDDYTVKTLEEVGKYFGVTRERARQVEARALKHLKEMLQKVHANYNTFR